MGKLPRHLRSAALLWVCGCRLLDAGRDAGPGRHRDDPAGRGAGPRIDRRRAPARRRAGPAELDHPRSHLLRAALQPARRDHARTTSAGSGSRGASTPTRIAASKRRPWSSDGVLFTTGSWSVVFAIDARTGRQLWKYDPQVPRETGPKACCDVVNRGVALYKDKVYVGTLDGRLIALDATSGEPVWEVVTVDQSKPYTITGAPRVVEGKVIIGNGGAELGVRGYVSAYDAETGELVWRFYTVPGDPVAAVRIAGARARREDLEGRRVVEDRRRRHGVGLDGLRPRAAPALRRHRQRLAVEPLRPQPRRRRQSLSLVDPRAAPRHRRARLVLPGDAGRHLGLHRDAAHHPRRPRRSTAGRARSCCTRRRTASSTCSIARPASCSRPRSSPS